MGRNRQFRATGDALDRTERVILSLWDQGWSKQRISRNLEMPLKRVSNTISQFVEADETRRHKNAMTRGTNDLVAAINAERKAA